MNEAEAAEGEQLSGIEAGEGLAEGAAEKRKAFTEDMEAVSSIQELADVLIKHADDETALLTLGAGEHAMQVPLHEILRLVNDKDWMALRTNYQDDALEQVLFKLRLSEETASDERERAHFENNRAAFISAVQGAGSLEGVADVLTQFANPDTNMVTLGVFDNAREVPLDELLEIVKEGQWSAIGRKYGGIDDMLENAIFKLATAE